MISGMNGYHFWVVRNRPWRVTGERTPEPSPMIIAGCIGWHRKLFAEAPAGVW